MNDTLTYVLYYENILAVDEVVTLFTNVAIPKELTREQAAEMAGGFQINVVAEAVQTENVGNNAVEAFLTISISSTIATTPLALISCPISVSITISLDFYNIKL